MRACAVTVVVATIAVAGCGSSPRAEGPLAASANATNPGISGAGGEVGSVYATGLVTLTNPTGYSLVLDSVELLGGRGGLALVGTGVQRDPAEGEIGLEPGYPPDVTTPIAPLRGAVIAPHERNVSVVVAAKAIHPGADSFNWVRLDYRIAGNGPRYRVDFPVGIQVCVPRRSAKRAHCPPPEPGGSK